MRIAVVTMWADNYKEIHDITYPVLFEYCCRHQYALHELKLEDGNSYHFRKHKLFSDLVYKHDIEAMFYLDVDCLVTNLNIKVEDFIEDEFDFYITKDVHELNGGAIILKNTPWGNFFNDFVLDQEGTIPNEQNVYVQYADSLFPKMKVIPHPSINSYDYSLYPEYPNIRKREEGHHHEGDFILHVPGAPFEVRVNKLKTTKIKR